MHTYGIRIVGDVHPMWYSEATSETKAVAAIKKEYPELDLEVVPNGDDAPPDEDNYGSRRVDV